MLAALARNPVLLVLILAGGGGLVSWRITIRRQRARAVAEAQRREAEIYAARALAIESYHSMNAREFEESLATCAAGWLSGGNRGGIGGRSS